jgi:hypothetical protein
MKGNPLVPGGPLMSKPTWLNAFGCSATSFFLPWLGRLREVATSKSDAPDEVPCYFTTSRKRSRHERVCARYRESRHQE